MVLLLPAVAIILLGIRVDNKVGLKYDIKFWGAKVLAIAFIPVIFMSPEVATIVGSLLAVTLLIDKSSPASVDIYVKIVSAVFLACAILTLTGATT